MNKEDFIRLSLNPNQISKEYLGDLESVLEEYPYFQAAQVLHLKGLKLQRSFKYNNTLKRVAAYTTNRTVLFDFITTDVLDYEEKSKKSEELLYDIEVVDSKLIDHLQASIATQKNEDQLPDELTKVEKEVLDLESDLEIGKPIQFDKNDEFSFNEWLDFTPKKEIKREKTIKKLEIKKNISSSKLANQVNLIGKFVANNKKIKPSKTQEIKDVAMDSVVENKSIMTETLARVYLEQKKYDKAISAFKILSLKYPEKSSFFADRIKAIKSLQKHKS